MAQDVLSTENQDPASRSSRLMSRDGPTGKGVDQYLPIRRGAWSGARFALTKFRVPVLPGTLVTRSALHDRLTSGTDKRLTLVVGSAGTGKSVLLSSWAATRPAGLTTWLSCDEADSDPVRFWTAFIEAARMNWPGFGADALDLLSMDHAMSRDVIASIANDAAGLPARAAVVVDDLHAAAPAVSEDMADLVERWPAENTQLVLVSRFDPAIRLHRLRISDQLCELRNRDLGFSLAESGLLLSNFDVEVGAADLALLHQRSEGWAAALQMAALSLRGTSDPVRIARALDVVRNPLAEYFISEVLRQQPAEVAQFMLDTSILSELTADACVAVTGRMDAALMLSRLDAASLFVVPLDEERTVFRYHHLVAHVMQAELRARDRAHEQDLQLRAANWYQSSGDMRQAAHHLLAAGQIDQALALLQDHVFPDYVRDPGQPAVLDLGAVAPSLLAEAPGRLLGLAADLLLSGDIPRGAQYLDLLERMQPSIRDDSRLAARFAAMRSFHLALIGRVNEAIDAGLTAQTIQERTELDDDWNAAAALVLLRIYTWLQRLEAVEHEAAVVLAMPAAPESVTRVLVPGARALAWFEFGRLAEAADAAKTAQVSARSLGFDRHFFAVDHLRALAGLALERRDLDAAERLTEQVLSIAERRRPCFEFLAQLDRAEIWATRGQIRTALTTIASARAVIAEATPELLTRADELEALLRLSLGDPHSARKLASRLPATRRDLLLARVALTIDDSDAAQAHLHSPSLNELTPRQSLVRQILLAAAAIERDVPMTASIVAGVIQTARQRGFLNTVITTASQVTDYLIGHAAHVPSDPFREQLITAAVELRATSDTPQSQGLVEPLTAAEARVLKLLPTNTYLQIAAVLYISRNTVKTHLRSVYQKLGVSSRSQAIERAIDLRLI
jgi:LuxR family transcriptional regulator, maltose regulon positive regulatory protein